MSNALDTMSDERRAIFNESSVLHRRVRKSRPFIAYRSSLVAHRSVCTRHNPLWKLLIIDKDHSTLIVDIASHKLVVSANLKVHSHASV